MLEEVGATFYSSPDFVVDEAPQPQYEPKKRDENTVINQVPNPSHNIRGAKEISVSPMSTPLGVGIGVLLSSAKSGMCDAQRSTGLPWRRIFAGLW